MKLFAKKKEYTWHPKWTYETDGIFWRLKISDNGRILCEARNPEQKTAWFNAIDELTGKVLWEGVSLEEPWWVGVEDLAEGRVYLHTFRKPDMPQHLGIYCYDMETGEPLWENKDLTFLLADGLQVYATAQGFEAKKYFLLNPETGEVDKEFGIDIEFVNLLRERQNEEFYFRNYSYPAHFDVNHPVFETHGNQVRSHIDPGIVHGNLDVLSTHGLLLLSWHEATAKHTPAAPQFNQQFLAVEIASDSVIYADTINAGVDADAIDSFFVKDNQLLYIKERSILTSFALPTE